MGKLRTWEAGWGSDKDHWVRGKVGTKTPISQGSVAWGSKIPYYRCQSAPAPEKPGASSLQLGCKNAVLCPGPGLPSHSAHLSSRLGRLSGILFINKVGFSMTCPLLRLFAHPVRSRSFTLETRLTLLAGSLKTCSDNLSAPFGRRVSNTELCFLGIPSAPGREASWNGNKGYFLLSIY